MYVCVYSSVEHAAPLHSQAWLVYSPCKNNSADAAASVLAGIPAGSAFTAESDQCSVYGELLRRVGAYEHVHYYCRLLSNCRNYLLRALSLYLD